MIRSILNQMRPKFYIYFEYNQLYCKSNNSHPRSEKIEFDTIV